MGGQRSSTGGRPASGGRPGRGRDPSLPVRSLRIRRPPNYVPAAGPGVTILHEDADVVAVDKPPGVNVAQENETETLPSLQTRVSMWLERKREGSSLTGPRARLVHRLDKDTSGVVLFAKSPRAQSALGKDFEAGHIDKIYLALVRGLPKHDAGEIDRPIGRDRVRKDRRAVNGLEPQESKTIWRVLERFPKRNLSLMEVRPVSGRTHQIRVHLAHLGHALAIDPLYAPDPVITLASMTRVPLHAKSITFGTPASGGRKRTTVEAPLPPDFAKTLDELRR